MRMRIAFPLVAGALALGAAAEAHACSCYGAPWLVWPEAEVPADHAMIFDSCWTSSFVENLRVSVDGVAAELVVDGPTTGNRYLGLRIEPAPVVGQTILLEACDVDCGDPGDWTEQSTLTVVAPLDPPAPEAILGGTLTHTSGSWEPECGVLEFRVDLGFEVTPSSHVMYRVDLGLDGQDPIASEYLRVLADGGVTERSITEYFVDQASVGVPPEDLCATVVVYDFAGGASDPVQICGSVEDPGGTGGDSDSGGGTGGSGGGTGDDGSGSGDGGTDASGGSSGGMDEDGSGCSCRAGERGSGSALWIGLLAFVRRRRR